MYNMYRVLIVDDERLMRDALCIMISKVKGFEVVAAVSNGTDAISYCKNNPVDIVFMDIIMPGITGMEASKEILSLNLGINIYILSAYSNFEFAREALSIKINGYILKPVSASKIRMVLENHYKSNGMSIKQADILFTLINKNDYSGMYKTVPDIVEKIFNVCSQKNVCEVQRIFENLKKNMMYTLKLPDKLEANGKEIFQISETMSNNKKCMEFWLYKVMDYIFQKNSIIKYPVLKDVFEYIENHIKENIGLSDITNKCSISQGYLSRIFKTCFCVSVMEYLHMKKIMIAKSYLTFTKLSVAEIAFRLGYNESNYFGKVFKKYEYITAFQYRKNVFAKGFYVNAEGGEAYE